MVTGQKQSCLTLKQGTPDECSQNTRENILLDLRDKLMSLFLVRCVCVCVSMRVWKYACVLGHVFACLTVMFDLRGALVFLFRVCCGCACVLWMCVCVVDVCVCCGCACVLWMCVCVVDVRVCCGRACVLWTCVCVVDVRVREYLRRVCVCL